MKLWIARDKNGKICVYTAKPIKASDFWYLEGAPYTGDFAVLKDDGEFASVKWKDEEPTEVELKIKASVQADKAKITFGVEDVPIPAASRASADSGDDIILFGLS